MIGLYYSDWLINLAVGNHGLTISISYRYSYGLTNASIGNGPLMDMGNNNSYMIGNIVRVQQ